LAKVKKGLILGVTLPDNSLGVKEGNYASEG